MQDINSIEGVCIFGGGDRRLRPQQQAFKCPRCDSLNTKFCYYNNYNLSQPRHFCKSCRRYWTKGGILRNVPVGGGCRKAKRTKNKASSAMSHPEQQQRKTNSHSSSDSSSLTATNSNAALTNNYSNNSYAGGGGGTAEAVTSHANLINNISEPGPEPKFYGNANNLELEAGPGSGSGSGSDQCGIFSSEVGSFTSLIAPSNNETFSFGFNHKVLNGEGIGMGESGLEVSNNGFGALDWQAGNGDQGLFDLPNHVDKTYWTQTQWTHQDEDHPTLYLP